MQLFYAEEISEGIIQLSEEESHHAIKVLRKRVGEELLITDGKGNLVVAKLISEGKKAELEFKEWKQKEQIPLNPFIKIAICPTKNIDRLETFIEKACEFRVNEIAFLISKNSERKTINLEKIHKKVVASCKQSVNIFFPKLHPPIEVEKFVQLTSEKIAVAHCQSKQHTVSLDWFKEIEKITVCIGPEGDFTPSEVELFRKANALELTLGEARLRTETAGILVASFFYLSKQKK